ncbi:MAG: SprT-like domain-containing protein [Patescibacteria group bacterium]|nr:SprT-like domain-containing protein [Patescibacteria group bacterium]
MSYQVTKKKVKFYYTYLNKLVFHSHLPSANNIEIVIFNKRGLWAEFEYNRKKNPPFIFYFHKKYKNIEHFLNILIHEMIHLVETLEFGRPLGHGKHFKKWKEKLGRFNFILKEKY